MSKRSISGEIVARLRARQKPPAVRPRRDRSSFRFTPTLIIESVPIVTGIASIAGLRLLDRYLARHGLEIGQVAGLSDYLRAILIGAVAFLPAAALLLVSMAAAPLLRERTRLIAATVLLAPLLLIPISAAAAQSRFDPTPDNWDYLLRNLDILMPMIGDRPLALLIFCAMPAAGAGLLLRTALDHRPERPRVWWWLFVAVMGATVYQAAEPLAAIYDKRRQQENLATIDGLPLQRFRLTASSAAQDGVPPACRCGADILWNGERGMALQCAGGQAIAVVGPQNWTVEANPLWRGHENLDPNMVPISQDPAALRVRAEPDQGRRTIFAYSGEQMVCKARENLASFVASSAVGDQARVMPLRTGWSAFLPAASGGGGLGLRCLGGRLLVDMSHAAVNDDDPLARFGKSINFSNARLGPTPAMRARGSGGQLIMDGDQGLVERMSAFELDPLIDTIEIDGAAYLLEPVREAEQRYGQCLYAKGPPGAAYRLEMPGEGLPGRPPIPSR